MTARELVLGRIARALADVPADETLDATAVPRTYRRDDADGPSPVGRFLERVADYGAGTRQCPSTAVPDVVRDVLDRHGARRVVVPSDLPAAWRAGVPDAVADDGLTIAALDAADGVLTGCAVAIADTGTLVLASGAPGQGRRAATLLPDLHVAVVAASGIVATVPEALARLAASGLATRPLTFVSGPSATSDIEMNRVEGVHGPRRLEVVVLDDL